MNQPRSDQMTKTAVDEAAVIAYLQDCPDLLQQHPQLLEQLHLPHDCGNATSLIERQVQVLRQRLQDSSNKLSVLLYTARCNDVQFEKTRNLIIKLAACNQLHAFSQLLHQSFCDDFNADDMSLLIFTESQSFTGISGLRSVQLQQAQQRLDGLLNQRWALCQLPTTYQLEYLFITSSSVREFHSAALLPLWFNNQLLGFCCIVSKQKNHFHKQLGTLFLNHVADVASQVLGRLLQTSVV